MELVIEIPLGQNQRALGSNAQHLGAVLPDQPARMAIHFPPVQRALQQDQRQGAKRQDLSPADATRHRRKP